MLIGTKSTKPSQPDNPGLLYQAKLSAPAWWIKQAVLLSLLSLLVDKYG
jgi:hypothetical protein